MNTRYARDEWRPPGDLPEPPNDLPAPDAPEEISSSIPEAAPPEPTEIPAARDRAAFGRRSSRGLLALLGAALAQSCAMTPVVWTKPGVEPSAARAELSECRMLAADQMWRMTWEQMWPPSFYDPRFMPPFYRGPMPFWLGAPSSLELEQSLIDFCMHSKGYRLSVLPY